MVFEGWYLFRAPGVPRGVLLAEWRDRLATERYLRDSFSQKKHPTKTFRRSGHRYDPPRTHLLAP